MITCIDICCVSFYILDDLYDTSTLQIIDVTLLQLSDLNYFGISYTVDRLIAGAL